ncbi:Saccharopine dehydrogenase [Colletotrichum orbiculare MAFF 240422]|uniref:Saccharopine dehydrogenase [NAD(+), L-lysine-forming] n=1 Tax=Colletotrichum orbiculare (strain 104-T / ATCC 96160 / CBS 514.97 / LARS 414 / MAFF 240422) TaxID=1213857 RepID=N4V4L7_COLOR|nr:Saccharopine dehydrogenase [Colletotrichum orbiculare MAFF 240422]
MSKPIIHLRAETKPLEHRSALTPTTAKALIEAGYEIRVEKNPKDFKFARYFEDKEFESAGCSLVETGSWKEASTDVIILGLKEIEEGDSPLKHTFVHFQHCYKGQGGWAEALSRYPRGNGTLLDLEFLQHENGRRVAAFGYHAGFAGAALALEVWAWQLTRPNESFPSVESYPNETVLIGDVKKALSEGQAKTGKLPRVIVIGALGRCGSGAVDMCLKAGIPEENVLKWDIAETKKGGPFPEIAQSDIFVNCIYLNQPVGHFVNIDSLKAEAQRNLSVVCDVSADTTNPHNPVPIYTVATTFDKPTVPVEGFSNPPISVISIDHLPSLLPRESSEAFSNDLLPTLLELKNWRENPVLARAEKLFKEKVATLPAESLENKA